MISVDSVYKIGQLGRTHALRGEIVFFCDDDIFDRCDADCLLLMLDGLLVPFFIEEYRFQRDDRVLMKFDGIDTKEQATELVGADVYFPKDAAAKLDDGLSLSALTGYAIYDTATGTATAPLRRIDTATDNPLFELEDGTLIPVAEEWIEDIDHEKKTIRMTLPEGLLAL